MAEEGYDYTALAALADGLIVRVDAYEAPDRSPSRPWSRWRRCTTP